MTITTKDEDYYKANLYEANLREANLNGANLSGANLSRANLYMANLREANLSEANLREANLNGANLNGANLYGANLNETLNVPQLIAAQLLIVPSGVITGYKKCSNGSIVELQIPLSAKRSNATGRKCRASEAIVIEISGSSVGTVYSSYDPEFSYTKGKHLVVNNFDTNRWKECSEGIHFFLTREEAEGYRLWQC